MTGGCVITAVAGEGGPGPAGLAATTVTVYLVPSVSPVSRQPGADPLAVHDATSPVRPPGTAVTVYRSTPAPAADHRTSAAPPVSTDAVTTTS